MSERGLHRKIISTRSAGKGRIVSVFYSPLNLRYEVDYLGETKYVFSGVKKVSLLLALDAAALVLSEIKLSDGEKEKDRRR